MQYLLVPVINIVYLPPHLNEDYHTIPLQLPTHDFVRLYRIWPLLNVCQKWELLSSAKALTEH